MYAVIAGIILGPLVLGPALQNAIIDFGFIFCGLAYERLRTLCCSKRVTKIPSISDTCNSVFENSGFGMTQCQEDLAEDDKYSSDEDCADEDCAAEGSDAAEEGHVGTETQNSADEILFRNAVLELQSQLVTKFVSDLETVPEQAPVEAPVESGVATQAFTEAPVEAPVKAPFRMDSSSSEQPLESSN